MKYSSSVRHHLSAFVRAGSLWIWVLLCCGPAFGGEAPGMTLPDAVIEAQRLSGHADVLVASDREREAAQLYLQSHLKFQVVMEQFFEMGLRAAVKEHSSAEEGLLATDRLVAELRDLNLAKLWLLLDPDDRAFRRLLEEERTDLLRRFHEFTNPQNDDPLVDLLQRLYPEDMPGSRQLEALREGRLPASARWVRLANERAAQ